MSFGILAALIVTISPISVPEVAPPRVDPKQSSLLCKAQEKHVLLLYYTTYCPYSKKVVSFLKKIHKQLPMKNLTDDPQAKDDLKKVGGKMQVPCLVIDGKAMYESDAIIQWLSEHRDELENTPKK